MDYDAVQILFHRRCRIIRVVLVPRLHLPSFVFVRIRHMDRTKQPEGQHDLRG
jgi:hypothetical protein